MGERDRADQVNLKRTAATAIGIIALGAALSACGSGSAANTTGATGNTGAANTGGSGNTGAQAASAASVFNTFVSTVKKDISNCANRAELVQLDIGLLATNTGNTGTAGNSGAVNLYTYSQTGQTACDATKDQGIQNLISLSVPSALSGTLSTNDAPQELENWASSDMTAVMHDVQNIAGANGSDIPAQAQLQTDIAQSDQDASTIEAQFAQAATAVGVTNFKGLGLMTWSASSGNSGNTGSTGNTGNTG